MSTSSKRTLFLCEPGLYARVYRDTDRTPSLVEGGLMMIHRLDTTANTSLLRSAENPLSLLHSDTACKLIIAKVDSSLPEPRNIIFHLLFLALLR